MPLLGLPREPTIDTRGRRGLDCYLGALLGFVGWLAMMFIEPTPEVAEQRTQANAATLRQAAAPTGPTRTCPWCAEEIKAAANVCRYCGRDIEPIATPPQAQDPI